VFPNFHLGGHRLDSLERLSAKIEPFSFSRILSYPPRLNHHAVPRTPYCPSTCRLSQTGLPSRVAGGWWR
jgi:hypothetical protein